METAEVFALGGYREGLFGLRPTAFPISISTISFLEMQEDGKTRRGHTDGMGFRVGYCSRLKKNGTPRASYATSLPHSSARVLQTQFYWTYNLEDVKKPPSPETDSNGNAFKVSCRR